MNITHFFIAKKFALSANGNMSDWKAFWHERASIGPCITALLQANAAFEDCLIARKQIRVPRTKRRSSLQSSLLRFYWQSFQHHAYIFHEKIGLLRKEIAKLPYNFEPNSPAVIVTQLHQKAKKELFELKRTRGEIVHSWTREHPAVYVLGMVEILTENEELIGTSRKYGDLVGHSIDAAYDIRRDIKKWETKLETLNEELLVEIAKILVPQINFFNSKFKELVLIEK